MRLVRAAVWLAVVLLAGCQPQATQAPATPTPAAVVPPSPAPHTVAVVDLAQVMRGHRRWPELEALAKKIQAAQLRLANPPAPPPLPQTDFGPDLQAEADRLSAGFREEMRALEEQARARVEAYAGELHVEQEAKLAERQRQLNEELQKTLEAKRDELQTELDKFELTTMAEYRIPLLNLRLKADVVGVANEEEAKRISAEGERLTKERDGKIRAKAEALGKTLEEFQKAKTAEAESRFKALISAAEEEGNAKIRAKDAEERAALEEAAKEREQAIRAAVEERRRALMSGTEQQARDIQDKYRRQVQAEGQRLQAELQALTEQRLRLEDSVLAEVRIEIAAVAQSRKVDVVVAHAVAAPGAIDLTQDVIAKIRKP